MLYSLSLAMRLESAHLRFTQMGFPKWDGGLEFSLIVSPFPSRKKCPDLSLLSFFTNLKGKREQNFVPNSPLFPHKLEKGSL
jgi:hypothetical protein